ncbi:MAG: hypothetical protein HZC02_02465, partial [Candidatus Levybacteria bacterium]|nr:hypothetical protein [Candidatus Levybacteria bacterium]
QKRNNNIVGRDFPVDKFIGGSLGLSIVFIAVLALVLVIIDGPKHTSELGQLELYEMRSGIFLIKDGDDFTFITNPAQVLTKTIDKDFSPVRLFEENIAQPYVVLTKKVCDHHGITRYRVCYNDSTHYEFHYPYGGLLDINHMDFDH